MEYLKAAVLPTRPSVGIRKGRQKPPFPLQIYKILARFARLEAELHAEETGRSVAVEAAGEIAVVIAGVLE